MRRRAYYLRLRLTGESRGMAEHLVYRRYVKPLLLDKAKGYRPE